MPHDEAFCSPCWQSVSPLVAACPRCAEVGTGDAPSKGCCVECRRDPPAFTATSAPFDYGGQLAVALQRLKYAGAGHLARPLGRLLAPTLHSTLGAEPALVVPVPLHPRRLRERGYNQSALLARAAGARAIASGALHRVRPTAPQAGLDCAARRRNLQAAFRAGPQVRGRRVVLVDDVLTTGATARACSEALLEAGASAVHVVVLARA